MPKKNNRVLPAVIITSCLVGVGVVTYWVVTQQNRLAEIPVGANIVPQEALLTISVSTDENQWQQLRQFGTVQTQAELEKNFLQWRDRFLTAYGYNYQQDIQPWIGQEATIAFLPPETLNNTTTNPTLTNQNQALLMVLPIADQVAAQQVWETSKPQTQKWISRDYKGTQIQETQGTTGTNYSAAVLDQRFVVVSDNPQVTEKAIDTYHNGLSLAKIPGYTTAISKIAQPNRFAQVYLNVPIAARVAQTNPAQSAIPQGLARLKENQGLASSITIEPEGLSFRSISWLNPNSQRVHRVENSAGQMQQRLPSETFMMLSGGNLQQLWQDYVISSQSNPLTPFPPENLRAGFKSLTGLDLDRDLLSWMNSEFSLAIVPASTQAQQDFMLSLVLMIETSDRTAANKSFQQLEQVLQSRYQFKTQETQLANNTVTNWIAPFGTLTATRGWLDNNVAFITLGAPIVERLLPQPTKNLASTTQFQNTVPRLNPNNSQFFLDVNPTVKALPLPQLLPGQNILLEVTRSIGGTAAVSDERSIRYDIFVSLEKVE
ncbi:DUF3352 domain-containing protein [Gloeocapsopsis dulcis]|uniref:DUF3352 domain-containing protein n=1 Tax=Gloeocapsopsis dulcis AAB1 = 1H9 TaxID=1433147 RepID=A0A6N8FXS6_9CHRO|nr:DUF3352 domain-containing protein [Gloeocapsopsis dulcis]MUL37432.1 hypothetical protein [Gloeocapsopsis dulcis AAB1 = 1H9]WNN87406.1 DUF3352 domain-containing protein [Gloeocapsopsis dulcis]